MNLAVDQTYVLGTAALAAAPLLIQLALRRFDPFAPVWLFLVGYLHVYVIQAWGLRDWAVDVRGPDLVAAAGFRAFWALGLYLAVYYSGLGKLLARALPSPPAGWSVAAVSGLAPMLLAWGLYCAYIVIRQGQGDDTSDASPELSLFRSFPFMMLVAGILLIVTSRSGPAPRPGFFWAGLAVVTLYVLVWMFNGKRSHSLIGVLAGVSAVYVSRGKRPSWPVLVGTAVGGAVVVAVAIGWRNNDLYERSVSGFVAFLTDFRPETVLASLNPAERQDELTDPTGFVTFETEEYGGFLVMLDTVPEKSEFDGGASYLRCFSTYIPRFAWPDKPLFGREEWHNAWIAGSELKRDEEFTGPAIGMLGAFQLNGGAPATALGMTIVALMHATGFEFYRRHAAVPWAQAFWSLTYYNAWMMVVNDDPMIWYYYNWGLTCLPVFVLLWVLNGLAGSKAGSKLAAAAA